VKMTVPEEVQRKRNALLDTYFFNANNKLSGTASPNFNALAFQKFFDGTMVGLYCDNGSNRGANFEDMTRPSNLHRTILDREIKNPHFGARDLESLLHEMGHMLELEPAEFYRLRMVDFGMKSMHGLKKTVKRSQKQREYRACMFEYLLAEHINYNLNKTDWIRLQVSVHPDSARPGRPALVPFRNQLKKDAHQLIKTQPSDYLLKEWQRRNSYLQRWWSRPAGVTACAY
jgi:hypothetical protein